MGRASEDNEATAWGSDLQGQAQSFQMIATPGVGAGNVYTIECLSDKIIPSSYDKTAFGYRRSTGTNHIDAELRPWDRHC